MTALTRIQPVTVPSLFRQQKVLVSTLVLLTCVAISPAFLVEVPAMGDYLNHLARMHLLVKAGSPEANPFYQVSWGLYPNLAMDLLVPQLARLMSVEAAAKVFLIVSHLLIVTGAVAVELAVKGRLQISGFAALIVLHSRPFAFGLLNFEFGLGLALFGFALWIALENRAWHTRLVVHSLFVLAITTAHFFALGIYGATIGFYEMSRMSSRNLDARSAMGTIGILAGPMVVILALMLSMGGAVGGGSTEWVLDAKLLSPLLFMSGYDYALSVCIVAVLAALLYFLFREHCLSLLPAGKWIAGGLLILYLLLPFRLWGTANVDFRMIIAAMLILPAFLVFSPFARWVSFFAGAVAAGVILVNTAHVASTWLSYDDEYAAMKASFRLIKPGSSVLVGHSRDDGADLPFRHAPALAAHYAGALVPSLYALPGMQPLALRPEFRRADDPPHMNWIPLATLMEIARGHASPEMPQRLRAWHENFDYLFVIGPPGSNPLPEILDETAIGGRFILYRIRR